MTYSRRRRATPAELRAEARKNREQAAYWASLVRCDWCNVPGCSWERHPEARADVAAWENSSKGEDPHFHDEGGED